MAQTRPSESDEGKKVFDKDGNEIGIVSGYRGGKAYIDPDPGIGDTVLSKLGWENIDEDDYALEQSDIETITDDEIHLRR